MQFSVLIIAKERNRFLKAKSFLRAYKNVSETVPWFSMGNIIQIFNGSCPNCSLWNKT